MARSKTTPPRHRGSKRPVPAAPAAPSSTSARARKAGTQASLPGVPDGRNAKLEALDVELVAARQAVKAESDQRKAIEVRMVEVLQQLGLAQYRTASGFIVRAEPKVKLTRKPAPKSKREARVV